MDEEVVLVTINYRLGVFGFLSTGDASIRGNMGLKDQVLSLKWIKENIEAFGGNPDQITIFGESAGGASVHYLLLSPQTPGLFQRAISQSGVATEPFAYDTPEGAKAFARKYSRDVKCPAEDSAELVRCLRSRSTDELLGAAKEDMQTEIITHPHKNGYLLRPTIEAVNDSETFLAEHPLKVIAEGRASRVPWMSGLVAEEGLLSSVAFYKNEKFLEEYEEKFESQIFQTFGIPPPNSSKDIAKKIRDYYFPKEIQSTQERIHQFTKLFSDANFNLQMSRTALLQRNFSPVYLYYYSKTGGPSLAPFLAGIKGNYPLILELIMTFVKNYLNEVLFGAYPKDYGVCHGDDLAMQFYMPYIFQVKKDSRHYKFSKDVVAFWVAFAKDPSTAKFRGVELPILKPKEKLQYLEITETAKIIPEPFEDRLKFLTSLNFHKR
jgi:juvenile-hormone esterase